MPFRREKLTLEDAKAKLIAYRLVNKSGCWIWIGSKTKSGYGVIWFDGKYHRVHRVAALMYLNHPLNSDLEVCHKCDTPLCYNPEHLFIGTHTDNMRDMVAKGRHGIRPRNVKMWCRNGHEFTPENTFINSNGFKECRICRKASKARWRLK